MVQPFNDGWFRQLPVVGILRGFSAAAVERLVPASLEGGLRNLEVTLNSPGAEDLIRLARSLADGRANVGAGTVTSLADLERALSAGASFIVTPILIPEVIRACVAQGVPVMPGALSPTEILTAWELGARCVKVFPADGLGPDYLRALRAPLPHVALMPTGGVTVESLRAYREAGAAGYGVGGPLFDAKRAAAGDWDWFRLQAARFVAAYAQP